MKPAVKRLTNRARRFLLPSSAAAGSRTGRRRWPLHPGERGAAGGAERRGAPRRRQPAWGGEGGPGGRGHRRGGALGSPARGVPGFAAQLWQRGRRPPHKDPLRGPGHRPQASSLRPSRAPRAAGLRRSPGSPSPRSGRGACRTPGRQPRTRGNGVRGFAQSHPPQTAPNAGRRAEVSAAESRGQLERLSANRIFFIVPCWSNF